MSRLRVWTGSRWSDAKVWTGTRWKSYSPPVFGATAYRTDFTSAVDGWEASLGNLGHHPNGHVFADNLEWNIMGSAGGVRYNVSTPMTLDPTKTIRAQASVYIHPLIHGSAGMGGGKLSLSASIQPKGYYSALVADLSAPIEFGEGGWGWGAMTTDRPIALPQDTETLECTMTYLSVSAQIYGGIYGITNWTYRMYVDWFHLIDQNGNTLAKMSSPAVDPAKIYTGMQWS